MTRMEIQFNGIEHSRPDENFVRTQLKEWLAKRLKGKGGSAKIEFFSGPFDQRVGCYVEVVSQGTLWRNFEYGKGVSPTLKRCLTNLNEISELEHKSERSA